MIGRTTIHKAGWLLAAAAVACHHDGEPLDTIGTTEQEIIRGTDLSDAASERSGLVLVGDACTGTLLNEHWVLTAAHCFLAADDADNDGEIDSPATASNGKYHIYLGNKQGNEYDSDGNWSAIIPNENVRVPERILRHPDGVWQSPAGLDLALVRLRDPATLSNTPPNHLTGGRMALYTGSPSALVGQTVTCMGYGKSNGTNGTGPWDSVGTLRTGRLRVSAASAWSVSLVSPSGDGTHVTCNGDSGGPCFLDTFNGSGTLATRTQIGVHSTSWCDIGSGSSSHEAPPDSSWIANVVYPNEQFRQEAEIGALTSPMAVYTDSSATGDRYIGVPAGTTSTGSVPSSGSARFTFNIAPPDPVEWTPWFDRDDETGNGDGEHLGLLIAEGHPACAHPISAECRRRRDGLDHTSTGEIVSCTALGGAECLNANQSDGMCDDYEVRFACPREELWTAWTNQDGPTGSGDHERTLPCANPLGIECRRRSDGKDWTQTGEQLTCAPTAGLVCLNSEQPDGTCDDYEVRFVCPPEDLWTPWFNRDAPSGNGDGEHLPLLRQEGRQVCEDPIGVQCRAVGTQLDHTQTGEIVSCSRSGSVCLNSEQPDGQCEDYEVRFACPKEAPKPGNYYLWARAAAPNGGADSFYVRFDGGSWVTWNNITGNNWHWERVVNSNASNARVMLNMNTPGNHTLEVRYREGGAKLDRFFITRDPNAVPGRRDASDPEAPEYEVSANATSFAATVFELGYDPAAPYDAGYNYGVPAHLASATSAPDASKGTTRVCVRMRDGGNYNLLGTVLAPSGTQDSFWVRVDNGTWRRWMMASTSSSWQNMWVTDANASNQTVTLPLGVGQHCLDVWNRESGTKFSRFQFVATAP